MPRTRSRSSKPSKTLTVATKILAAATKNLSVDAKHRLQPIQTRYRSRRQTRSSLNDTPGDIYVLEGRFKGTTFLKIGRSVDSDRRIIQHTKTCKRVVWTKIGSWQATRCHKA
ncbi:hypothetical protein PQX77_000827, partial [Marasmius sp. AFHP31]